MMTRTVRAEFPIEDSNLPAPHLRLLARGMLTEHLDQLGVVAVTDAVVRVSVTQRVVEAVVEVRQREAGMWHPAGPAVMCPSCHAVVSGVAA
ncbi:MAG: hypothetical protein L0L69_11605 [Propionibacterium sp.]|nr:hypothetical protein [Propionibacterium sp.]MDN6795674.1 hypothetical protein [Propionibacterium sp.]